jgi:hypothetical protein
MAPIVGTLRPPLPFASTPRCPTCLSCPIWPTEGIARSVRTVFTRVHISHIAERLRETLKATHLLYFQPIMNSLQRVHILHIPIDLQNLSSPLLSYKYELLRYFRLLEIPQTFSFHANLNSCAKQVGGVAALANTHTAHTKCLQHFTRVAFKAPSGWFHPAR